MVIPAHNFPITANCWASDGRIALQCTFYELDCLFIYNAWSCFRYCNRIWRYHRVYPSQISLALNDFPCVVATTEPVISEFTTASMQESDQWQTVDRIGLVETTKIQRIIQTSIAPPLTNCIVNETVIGWMLGDDNNEDGVIMCNEGEGGNQIMEWWLHLVAYFLAYIMFTKDL